MGRGVSSGGGQSSLGYLFGGGEAPKPAAGNSTAVDTPGPAEKPLGASPPVDNSKQIPAGIQGNTSRNANNYLRADGQNCGNFLTIVLQLRFMPPLVVVLPLTTCLVALVTSDVTLAV